MPEAKKMELILSVIGNRTPLQGITIKDKKETYYGVASNYFKKKQEQAMAAIDQISKMSGELAMNPENRQKLDALRQKWGDETITSEEGLRKFKNQYAQAVIDTVERMCAGNPVFLKALKKNVEILHAEPGMEKLTTAVSIPTTTEAMEKKVQAQKARYEAVKSIDDALKGELLLVGEIHEKIQNMLDVVRKDFIMREIDASKTPQDFKKDYMNAIIIKTSEFLKDNRGLMVIVDSVANKLAQVIDKPGLGFDDETKVVLKQEIVILQNKIVNMEAANPLAGMIQKGLLTEEEKNEFLERAKEVTDYGEFQKKLHEHYPQTNPDNAKQYIMLNKLKNFGIVGEIKNFILEKETDVNAKILIQQIKQDKQIKKTIGVHRQAAKMTEEDLDGALLQYIFEIRRDIAIGENEEDKKAFLKKYPQFRFILDQSMYEDFRKENTAFKQQKVQQ